MNSYPDKSKKGYIPVMLSTFKDNGELDYDGLTRLTEFYIEAGVTGLFANCLSSEMFELSNDERIKVIEHVVKVVNGRVPVFAAGTFSRTVEEQAGFIKTVNDTGVQAVVIITGMMAHENEPDNIFNDRIFELIRLTGNINLGLYECPVPYKKILSAIQLKQFVDTGRIVYLKETSLDIEQVRAKIEAVGDNKVFGLYDAYMVHAVDSLKAGSAGLSCIQGNFFAELIVWLCHNYNNPELKKEVDKVQQFLTGTMDTVHHVYPTVAKYYLQKRGLGISTFTRRKTGVFSAGVKNKIDKLFTDSVRLQEELGINILAFPLSVHKR